MEICSKCHESFMNCKCEQFHPTLKIPLCNSCGKEIKDNNNCLSYHKHCNGVFSLNIEELNALNDFLYKEGYISHEFHPLIHKISKRIDMVLRILEQSQ